jgi:putative drug exporter of the RND superfamily
LTALARIVIRFRVLIIAFWLVIAAFAVPRASRVNEVLSAEGRSLTPTESDYVRNAIESAFSEPVAKFFAIALSGPVPVDSAPYPALINRLSEAAEGLPYIDEVLSYASVQDVGLLSADRKTTFLVATFKAEDAANGTNLAPEFREIIHRTAATFPGSDRFQIYVTGEPALDHDVRAASTEDAKLAERRSLLPTGVVLILAFGALVAAVLPIIVGMLSITCALAAVHVTGSFYPMSVFVMMIVTMLGLGVGIDYSLLIVTRFREEMNRGLGAREAAIRTMLTAGKAVITSGLTVLVGFASLLLTPLVETRSVGIGGLLVVGIAVLLSTTLLPAVLGILGRAIDWPKWMAARLAWYHAPTAWERWARFLSHHPVRAILIGLSIIGLLTWPLFHIEIGLPRSGWFPGGTESASGVELLERIGSRGALQPVRILFEAPEGQRVVGARYIRGLRRFSDTLKTDARVHRIRGPVDIRDGMSLFAYLGLYGNLDRARERFPEFFNAYVSPDARIALMDVVLTDTTTFNSAMQFVSSVRSLAADGVQGLDSVTVSVGGFAASSLDLQEDLLQNFPTVVTLVLLITAVMLLVAFQSILVPIKAVVMNCLSVAASFGLLVLVFQEGFGGGLFGVKEATEAIYVVVPVLVFAVVFGLSMDYEVFLLARMKESFKRTRKNELATMEGISVTASVITSAAVIMIIVFGMFTFSRVFPAKLMGFGLAVAVFLDATLIRMVLVPAFMHLAGRWNWWPGLRVTAASEGDPSMRSSGEVAITDRVG